MPTLSPNPATTFTSKAWVGSADPITSGNGVQLDFQRFGLQRRVTLTNLNGMRGTRSQFASRTRTTSASVSGPIVFEPTPIEMAGFLKYCLGGNPTGTSYPLAETLPSFVVGFLKGNQKYYTYGGCKVDSVLFRSGPNQPLEVTMNVISTSRSVAVAGSAPAGTALDVATNPFCFCDLALTLAGNVQDTFNFSLEISNRVIARQVNAVYPTTTYPSDRQVTLTLEPAYGDDPTVPELDPAGVAVSSVFTAGTVSVSFVMPKVQFSGDDGETGPGREEIHYPMTGTARANSGAGDELVVTLDSTV